jgi:cobalamin-dependent methionine synthase I
MALKTYTPLDLINTVLLDGMKTVGELFGAQNAVALGAWFRRCNEGCGGLSRAENGEGREFAEGNHHARDCEGRRPNLKDQTKIFALLHPEENIGVRLTEQYHLEPEQSTDALIVHHPQAKYFVV